MYASLLPQTLTLACAAGDAILSVYNTADFNVDMKADNSPLTQGGSECAQNTRAGFTEAA